MHAHTSIQNLQSIITFRSHNNKMRLYYIKSKCIELRIELYICVWPWSMMEFVLFKIMVLIECYLKVGQCGLAAVFYSEILLPPGGSALIHLYLTMSLKGMYY